MVITDKDMVALVEEQSKLFIENASQDNKIDVYKRIIKRQKQLMKNERGL